MKVLIIVFGALILLGGLIFFGLQKIGDVRPAVLPASPNTLPDTQTNTSPAGTQQVGSDVDLRLPAGFKIGLFSPGLGGARDLQFSPGGVLLVSDSGGRVLALPDKNNDGRADEAKVILSGLNRPHGLAFYKGKLYLAENTKVSRYNWDEPGLTASLDRKILDLPSMGGHSTRSMVIKDDGRMFISLGSSCNVCVEKDPWLAAVIVTQNPEGANPKIYSKGLRNAVFMALETRTDEIWVTEMGRDFLGDNLPPEEVNILKEGGDFGWPNCYGNKIPDTNFSQIPASVCLTTTAPTFEIPAHSAPLGLTFINSNQFPADWQGDLLVALHGSWNSSVPVGYKVVRLNREGDNITGSEDFITGFLKGSQAGARPVDLTFDSAGSLYLSDDKSGSVYKIIHE